VYAFRLLEVDASAPGWTRRLDSPLVGRRRELASLERFLEDRVEASNAGLATLMGAAGAGKSRLCLEFLEAVGGGTTVLSGRCLPYGEGITFWPIADVLREAAGIDDRQSREQTQRRISELVVGGGEEAALVAERLAPLVGADIATPGIQETFWAVRKLFESLGSERPLVVVFDDIQWAEQTFLDLLEYLADWIRTAPVLLLCLARPELLELRPGWTSAKPNAALVQLERLNEAEIDGLIQNLTGGAGLDPAVRVRIAELAEGNPLFVEETLRMLVDDGVLEQSEGIWSATGDLSGLAIPATINALVTARLDRLDGAERAVVERAAIVGRVFSLNAVTRLSPAEMAPRVILSLQSLMRKELVRPDHSLGGDETTFRFTHILVRDAAYAAIPKADRAELHERLAEWLAVESNDLAGEWEEIVGYHLEQAHSLLLELGPPSERTERIGLEAARELGAAGRRHARGGEAALEGRGAATKRGA
jgi:predicted ATPase